MIMKVKITSLFFGFMLFMGSFQAKATVFYVTDGEEFSLVPAITAFSSFIWKIDDADPAAGEVVGGTLTTTFQATSAVAKHTISLSVIDGVSCASVLISHTVYVLPRIVVTATTAVGADNFCIGAATFSTEITASLSQVVTDFKDSGISVSSTYKWYKDASTTPISDATTNKLTVSAVGTYRAIVEYVIPGNPTTTKLTEAITSVGKEILKTLPVPLTPDISLQ